MKEKKIWFVVMAISIVLLLGFTGCGSSEEPMADGNAVECDGLRLVVPDEYWDLLAITTKEDGGIYDNLFRVREKASVEAAEVMGAGGDVMSGAGDLFSIYRVDEEGMQEFVDRGTGCSVFAKDNDGYYYVYDHPTDVRLVRASDEEMEEAETQWDELRAWGDTVPESFTAENGLTEFHPETDDYSDIDSSASADRFVTYEMWDSPQKGSGASNDDPHHWLFWRVDYDGTADTFNTITVTHIFDHDYSEQNVGEYKERLEKEVYSGREYDFVDINMNYNGDPVMVLTITYNNLDNADHRHLLGRDLFMGVDVGDSFTELDSWIRAINGIVDHRSISDEQDAVNFAKDYALTHEFADSSDQNFVVEYNGISENERADGPCYSIHGYDDMEDHTATLFWWSVDDGGTIRDDMTNNLINKYECLLNFGTEEEE